jgi:hypothetical protein
VNEADPAVRAKYCFGARTNGFRSMSNKRKRTKHATTLEERFHDFQRSFKAKRSRVNRTAKRRSICNAAFAKRKPRAQYFLE